MSNINMNTTKPLILKSRYVSGTAAAAQATTTKGNIIQTSVGSKGPMVIATLRADGKVYAKDSQSAKQLATMHYKIRPVNTTTPAAAATTTTMNKSLQTLGIPTPVVDLGKQLLVNARDGNIGAVKSLILRDAPFSGDWLGMTALHFAAMNNQYEICEILLKNGINKDSRTKTDRTALHLACHNGNESIVRLLLSKKCQINPCDMLHMTPLHWAVEKRHKSIARLLISHGADVTVISKFGKTPIALAVSTEQADILQELQAARRAQIEQKMHVQREIEISSAVNSIIEHDNSDDIISHDATETSNENGTNSQTVHLLQKHGIALQKHKENESKDLLNTVLRNGRQFILSEGGKMLLTEAQNNLKNSFNKKPTNSVLLVSAAATPTQKASSTTTTTTANLPRNITVNTIHKNSNQNLQMLPQMKILVNPNSSRLGTSARPVETKKVSPSIYSDNNQNVEVTTLEMKNLSKTSPVKTYVQIKQEHNAARSEETDKVENETANVVVFNGIENSSNVDLVKENTCNIFSNKYADLNCQKTTTTLPKLLCTATTTTSSTIGKPQKVMTTSNNSTTITQTAPGSVIPLFSVTNMCRQLFELRRQHNELKRKFELSQREKEDMRVRLARLESYVLQNNSNSADVDYIIDI